MAAVLVEPDPELPEFDGADAVRSTFDAKPVDPFIVALALGSLADPGASQPTVLPYSVALPEPVDLLYRETEDDEPPALTAEADPFIEAVPDAIAVREFVRGLPDLERHVVFGTFWLNMTQSELARSLRVHQTTVSRVLERALARGREVLGSTYAIAA